MRILQMCKKFVFLFCLFYFACGSAFAVAQSVDACDYDNVRKGNVTVSKKGDISVVSLSDGSGHGLLLELPANKPVLESIDGALKEAKAADKGNEIALLMRLNEPVCATVFHRGEFYISSFVEKDAYYAVNLCLPESGSCWYMKVNKNSALGGTLRLNGIKQYEEKVCYVTSAAGQQTILELYPITDHPLNQE